MKKILITGATGYIGRRLKDRLLQRDDFDLRLLVRNKKKLRQATLDKVEVVEGDTFNPDRLDAAFAGIEVAYYLIHSMGSGKNFEELDRRSAENFRDAAIRAGVKRIIYLGGLGVKESASRHLRSRIETGEILSQYPEKIQTIWFRAGVIIGAGSASLEIIRHLIEKLPVMITPRWVKTKTQPIAIDDVISYLEQGATAGISGNMIVDIGAEPMLFQEMLHAAARVLKLRRFIIPVPFLTTRLSAYWLVFITPVPFKIAATLVEGLRSETVMLNDNAANFFPQISPRSYDQGIRDAMAEIESDQVVSRWCDSSADAACDISGHDDSHTAILRDVREIPMGGAAPELVFQSACSIGGRQGWYTYNFLWQLRGFIDKLVGGYGLNRGRRLEGALRVGDALDFWKVADIKENRRLLLLAQMKLPGKAWLEFDIRDDFLVQTAHFLPRGLWGRLYWYSVSPLHHLVFGNLSKKIVRRAQAKNTNDYRHI